MINTNDEVSILGLDPKVIFLSTPSSIDFLYSGACDGIFRGYNGIQSHSFELKTNVVSPKSFHLPSKRHRDISDKLNNPEILTNPEKYFGPNYKTLLNFWIYWDSLTEEVKDKFYWFILEIDYYILSDAVGVAKYSTRQVLNIEYSFGFWEYEIIGMHNILDEGKSLTFIPMLENL
jgi:hypothetical protein